MNDQQPTILSWSQHGERVTFFIPDSFLDMERTSLLVRQLVLVMGFAPGQLENQILMDWTDQLAPFSSTPTVPTPKLDLAAFPFLAAVKLHGDDMEYMVRFAEKVQSDLAIQALERFYNREIITFEWIAAVDIDDQIKEA